ncbi:unnamed protein product [Tuber melanosporum]|uniref:(Perigord truffle) hypothetical protein n=1 Tax=Tuber melanosporum (strain Mel28) TaxID=656061 RepID=D5GF44_TUBMM|nr:uncharacterized protein GSTUM_00001390001 [Tuber melanosporum]CAZ83137.1 unnamed protein product [Tuber melanosporum]
MFSPLLLSAFLLYNPVRGVLVPRSVEPTPTKPSLVTLVVEITPAPAMPPVAAELLRRGSNPAIIPKDDSDLMRRQACGAYYVTCGSGSCCYLGQECYKNSAGGDSCRYPDVMDYSSLLASLTAIYGGNSFGYDAGVYSSIYSSYLDLLTGAYSLPGASNPTMGHNLPVSTARTGSSNSNSGSASSSSSSSTGSSTNEKKSNTGMIVGIAVGSAVGLAIIGAIVWYCRRKNRVPTPVSYPVGMAQGGTTPFQQYPQSQQVYAAQASQVDIKPPQVYQFQQQPFVTEISGTGIAPQYQVPPGNAFYAVQSTGYQGPVSPPSQSLAQEMSSDTQLYPPQPHQQQPPYGLPSNGTQGPPAEMDSGQRG